MKRNILIIVLLGLLLVGAAFVAGRLFRTQEQASSDDSSQPQMQVTPAEEVPEGDPTVDGFMDHRDGNSLFLCAFVSGPTIHEDGTVDKGGACGSMVEVVITHETEFLHDVSAEPRAMPTEGFSPEDWIVQQVVEPGDVSAITNQSGLQVWGEQNGSRVIADTILYWTARPAP
jgi:hypothetical protein